MIVSRLSFCLIVALFACTSQPRYTSGSASSSESSTSTGSARYMSDSNNDNSSNDSSSYSGIEKFRGISSYYGQKFHGRLTANGEVYDMYGLSAAHKTLPLNTIVRVTNLSNGKSQILRINDRGPYIDGRILDCSYGAAKKLDFLTEGTTEVEIVVMEWGDNKYMHHK
tara:strand:+ start:1833 stop:2336 length:504 start_codon:yes stop_codon:yes gene_type:complete